MSNPEDLSSLARIYSETTRKLEEYLHRVREGRDLQPALEFAGWVLWSGITMLCSRHAQAMPKIDGSHLRWKAEELQRLVRDKFRDPKSLPQIPMTQLQALNHKMDVLAALVARRIAGSESPRTIS